jgi:hypothetical protein
MKKYGSNDFKIFLRKEIMKIESSRQLFSASKTHTFASYTQPYKKQLVYLATQTEEK